MKPASNIAEIQTGPCHPWEVKQRADQFELHRKQQPPAPPAPLTLTDVQKIPLRQVHVALIATKDNLMQVNGTEISCRERLPGEQNTLADLMRNITADAPEADMLKIAAQEIRVRLLNDYIGGAAAKRDALVRQLYGLFGTLNNLLEGAGVTGKRFFLSGPRPERNADEALAYLATLLQQ